MKKIRSILPLRLIIIVISLLCVLVFSFMGGCKSQIKQEPKPVTGSANVGGGCDRCELMYTAMPGKFNSIDTSIGWYEEGQKLLVSGTVYKIDGKTPALGVIVYYYHTDHTGLYSKRNDKPGQSTAHGHIRGWVKSGDNGHYSIYTSRPVSYPKSTIPAHIHVI